MLKNRSSFLLLLTLLTYTTTHNKSIFQTQTPKSQSIAEQTEQITTAPQRLSEYNFGSGSVLPFIRIKGKKYFILSREAYGKAKGTYDDFGGSRDPGENHPVITAGREFFEEAIIEASTGLSLEDVYNVIDIGQSDHTKYIIAFSRNVSYITDFTSYSNALFKNFYAARKTMIDFHFKEKDRLALVDWTLLEQTIKSTNRNRGVQINAQVLDPQDQQWKSKKIILRDFFVKKLRPFFMNKLYKPGMNKKIRFYDFHFYNFQIQTQPVEQQTPKQESWSTRFWNWIQS